MVKMDTLAHLDQRVLLAHLALLVTTALPEKMVKMDILVVPVLLDQLDQLDLPDTLVSLD